MSIRKEPNIVSVRVEKPTGLLPVDLLVRGGFGA